MGPRATGGVPGGRGGGVVTGATGTGRDLHQRSHHRCSRQPLQAGADSPIFTLVNGAQAVGISTAVVALDIIALDQSTPVPRLYLENLLLTVVAGSVREEGVLRYAMSDTFPVSGRPHLDVDDVVARMLTTDTDVTGNVAVGHDPGLTGPDLADGFAARFDTGIRYQSVTPS